MVRGMRTFFILIALTFTTFATPVAYSQGVSTSIRNILAEFNANPVRFAAQAEQPSSNGAEVFADNCGVCHGADGKGTQEAPSLEAVSSADIVAQTVRSGKDGMPSFSGKLSDSQIDAVAQYVAGSIATTAVSLTGGDLSRGGELYRLNCAGCHSSAGQGGALVDAGENAPDLDDLEPSEIATAVRSGPGPMPVFPPEIFDQKDLSSIVMYVETFKQPDHPGGLSLGYRGPVTEGLAAAAAIALLALAAVWIERRGRG